MTLRSMMRSLGGRLQWSLGTGSLLMGVGYGLSFDHPLSYIPYGVCRSFEGISTTFAGLQERRLGVYDRASRFAERWRLESPFLNAYLLDRLCRESVTRHQRLQHLSYQSSLSLTPAPPKIEEIIAPISAPQEKRELQPVIAAATNNSSGPDSSVSQTTIPLSQTEASSSGSSPSSPSATVPVEPDSRPPTVANNSPATPSLWNRWSQSLHTKSENAKRKFLEVTTPAYLIGSLHDLLFPGAGSLPSYLSVLDRVHHLTIKLEPHCTDVDRVRSVYITLSNFLNFVIKQRRFHEQLFSDASLENDRQILQFFHTTLLTTHRMEYLNRYERMAVIPPAPPVLLSEESDSRPLSVWKNKTIKATEEMRGLVSSFSPSNKSRPKQIKTEEVTLFTRRKPCWSTQGAAIDCRRKMGHVWHAISNSRPLRHAAERLVWREEFYQSRCDVAPQQSQAALNSKIARTSEEAVFLRSAVRGLIKEFNKAPSLDQDLARELNRSLQTPASLNPFYDGCSASYLSQFTHWLSHGPVLPFLVGAAATAVMMTFDKSPSFMNGVWNILPSIPSTPAPPASDPTPAPPTYISDGNFYMPNLNAPNVSFVGGNDLAGYPGMGQYFPDVGMTPGLTPGMGHPFQHAGMGQAFLPPEMNPTAPQNFGYFDPQMMRYE